MSWNPPAPPLIKPEERPLKKSGKSSPAHKKNLSMNRCSITFSLHGALQAQRQEDQRSLTNTIHT